MSRRARVEALRAAAKASDGHCDRCGRRVSGERVRQLDGLSICRECLRKYGPANLVRRKTRPHMAVARDREGNHVEQCVGLPESAPF